jgi:hypothetical protein
VVRIDDRVILHPGNFHGQLPWNGDFDKNVTLRQAPDIGMRGHSNSAPAYVSDV